MGLIPHDEQLRRHRLRRALSSPVKRVRCAAKYAAGMSLTRAERRQARKLAGPGWKLFAGGVPGQARETLELAVENLRLDG